MLGTVFNLAAMWNFYHLSGLSMLFVLVLDICSAVHNSCFISMLLLLHLLYHAYTHRLCFFLLKNSDKIILGVANVALSVMIIVVILLKLGVL